MLEEHTGELSTRTSSFMLNLYKILSEKYYSDMITWKRSGTRSIIKNLVNFTAKVLPRHYKANKRALFSRQLSVHDFYQALDRRRKKQGKNASTLTFVYQFVKRDKLDSFHLIQCMSGLCKKPRGKLSKLRVKTATKSKISSSSSNSPALSSSLPMKSQPVNQYNGESKHTAVPNHDFLDYTFLMQEEINPNRNMLREPLILDGVSFTNCPDFSSPDISLSLYSSSTSSFSWETISPSLYENPFRSIDYC
ncbi:kinase-regulated stress-responsive transcription factor skn7 [Basidiobolus ranarum]|uniref:Kinase-regulated stress-responsive transcription factor skn7 n=1 Tax=Basidiobolus ranarum TaxID=34480 RepID=A0ABR2VPJ1_9FUNG